jgi:hypothetical protein
MTVRHCGRCSGRARGWAELTNRKLRRSAHRSVTELEAGIRRRINAWNKDPQPFVSARTPLGPPRPGSPMSWLSSLERRGFVRSVASYFDLKNPEG